LAILFGLVPFSVSDGAKQAVAEATPVIFTKDWKDKAFDVREIRASTLRLTEPH